MQRLHGFTLLELLTAIAVLAVLLTTGLPSFAATSHRSCVVGRANSLLSELLLARSEAMKRGRAVSVCKSADGVTCNRNASAAWGSGLVVFADDDGSGTRSSTERILKVDVPTTNCSDITANRYINYISFDSAGKANVNGSFFIAARNAPTVNRTLSVFVSRMRICNHQDDKSCLAPPS